MPQIFNIHTYIDIDLYNIYIWYVYMYKIETKKNENGIVDSGIAGNTNTQETR